MATARWADLRRAVVVALGARGFVLVEAAVEVAPGALAPEDRAVFLPALCTPKTVPP